MSFNDSFAFSKRLNEKNHKSNKYKIGGFGYAWFRGMGVKSEDLMTLSRSKIYQKYDIRSLVEKKKQQYKTQLLNIVKRDI